MEFEDRKKFELMIQEEIQKTIVLISSLEDITKPISPDNSIGRLSRMEAINEKSINEENLRQNKIRLQQLQAALRRVESEDFGYCKECEEEIPLKRMELLPESIYCVSCQEKTK